MNNVNIIGRLTRDPQVRQLQNGTSVTNFTLAIDKGLSKEKKEEFEAQNKPTADFINIVAWGKTGEFAGNYLAKGLRVGITGRLESGRYEDKDGKIVYTTDVNAFNIAMIDWKDNKGMNQSNNDDFPDIEGFHPTNNDSIPF